MKALIAMSVAVLAAATAARAEHATKHAASKDKASFVTPDEIQWGDPPPDLPRGAQMAVLHGDPSKHAPFAIRVKAPDGYRIAPHWHSQDEQLTVLSGTLVLHMGDTMDATAHTLAAGAYHFLPAKAHHAAESKGETVLQINGVGPFDIHYLNPADNPRSAAAVGGAAPSRKAAGRRP